MPETYLIRAEVMMPTRIQMSRQHPWRAEHPDAVIVDRRTKWGNPYRVSGETTTYEAVRLYRDLIERTAAGDTEPWMQDNLSVWNRYIKTYIRDELAGKDLACWCPLDQPCHADVLLAIAAGETP